MLTFSNNFGAAGGGSFLLAVCHLHHRLPAINGSCLDLCLLGEFLLPPVPYRSLYQMLVLYPRRPLDGIFATRLLSADL